MLYASEKKVINMARKKNDMYELMNSGSEEGNALKGSAENFLSQEQVREYNDALINSLSFKHSLMLGSPEEVEREIREYFELCVETSQVPSIKALALYMGVTFETLKEYMLDPISPYFNALNLARDMCHVVLENGAMNNKINPATYMFTAANYYGMKNTQSVEINKGTTETEKQLAKSEESLEALRKLINMNGDDIKPVKDVEYEEK
jgi:hypothetical protein